MTQPNDDETADQKFERFEKALKQVLTAPKSPSGNGSDDSEAPKPSSG